jgi:hypothetical protein
MENRAWRRNAVRIKQLDSIAGRIKLLEKYSNNKNIED